MITAVIFDMDGVLIDSQKILDVLEIEFLKEITNNKWTRQNQLFIHGKSIKEVFNLLISSYNLRISKKAFFERYEKILNLTYAVKCKLNPGVKDFLEDIISKKYSTALASSTPHRFINMVLDKFKLHKYLRIIVSADDTKGKNKPEPGIFLLTAKKLGVKPEECLVIEDSDNGIKAAKRAGMFCLQYANGVDKSKEIFADLIINTFRNLSANAVFSRLRNIKANIERVTLNGKVYYFQLSEKVNKSDYYSDFLLKELTKLIKKYNKKSLELLEIGTGRAYIPIIITSKFHQVKKIVGIDIDEAAVILARKNVWLNGLESKIEIRKGNLFSPLKRYEKFDFIFGAPPQIPITKEKLRMFIRKHRDISSYHLTTSFGGRNGQVLIRKLIKSAPKHLVRGGLLIEVQADFSFSNSLKKFIEKNGFKIHAITKKRKLLKETSLTKKLEPLFKKDGYLFKKNNKNEKYFNLLNIILKN